MSVQSNVEVMLNPFKLFATLCIAAFEIVGYIISFLAQAGWHLIFKDPSRIGEAIGELLRKITDALSAIFKRR